MTGACGSVWLMAVLVMITNLDGRSCSGGHSAQAHYRHQHHQHHYQALEDQMERAPVRDHLHFKPSQGVCPKCLLKEEGAEWLRLEAIKRQILTKLGLRSPPNLTGGAVLPRELVLETLVRAHESVPVPTPTSPTTPGHPSQSGHETGHDSHDSQDPALNQDDFFATTSEIIAFAEPGSRLNGQTLLELSRPVRSTEGEEVRVKSATLWIRLNYAPYVSAHPWRNLTLWVFRVLAHLPNSTYLTAKEFDERTAMVSSVGVRGRSPGWTKVDLTPTVESWYREGREERLRLLVDCSGCGGWVTPSLFNRGDSERPFLVVRTEPGAPRRVRRRALDCSGATKGQCCKQRFYVSFKQLGWDDWVIAPSGYYANYCRGDCSAHRTPDTYVNHYTHVIEEYRKIDRLAGLQPCCAPLRFSSTSLIYYGPDMNIIKRDLPKMVVEECGCP